jgi:hypothetical protein
MDTNATTFREITEPRQISLIDRRLYETDLERAILKTLAYADVFDYPLTRREIQRYLIGVKASQSDVAFVLNNGTSAIQRISSTVDLYTLPGREGIVASRLHRAKRSTELWEKAGSYGRLIARFPYVRMVAVTGALAVNNTRSGDDIDYLIVTEPGRLWTSRAILIALVRWAALRGDNICPNYFLSKRALVFEHRSLYTAHELVQMVPISGLGIYDAMRGLNHWIYRYLPNANNLAQEHQMFIQDQGQSKFQSLAEETLRSPLGDWLENWEMKRKQHKFLAQVTEGAEISFCADWCKGHFDGHGNKTLSAYAEKLAELGIADPFTTFQE